MANPIQREKMYEALAYFAASVRNPGQLKLFKLLYYLDLMHFRRTGRKVTDLTYQAWPMGPVPPELNSEFMQDSSELKRRFNVERFRQESGTPVVPTIDSDADQLERAATSSGSKGFLPGSLKPKTPYKQQYLSKREQDIATLLAEVFRDATAEQMSDVSHNKFGPWKKALHKAKQTGISRPEIDFLEGVVAVGKPAEELSTDELREMLSEQHSFREAMR